ncbi:MAG TPA: tripartite tricarboxylate transporter substrate binding protein [Xanthobacteraceae bacterium]|nr:tripartite tricarboxylate transporter substrate binding protein [Xanthobacteraceae bacterium]
MSTRRRASMEGILALCLSVGVLGLPAAAAADWPTRPVRIIVPFAAGGAADNQGRIYAEALSAAFGKQFVVENRTGGGGLIAAEAVARAAPDGYTLIVSGIPIQVLGPAMNQNVGYDPMRDFTHIAYFGGTPNVLVVHPDLGVRTYRDFVALARGRADGIDYVSAGVGTMGNWVAEYLAAKEHIRLTHVAYKGGAAALLDLLAGHVKVGMLSWSSVAEQIRAGALVPLAVTSAQRVSYLPDLPTLRELGFGDFVATTWFSLSGPAGLPADIVERINREVVKAMDRPQVRKQIEQDAIETRPMTAAEVTEFSQSEIDRWTPLIKKVMATKVQ